MMKSCPEISIIIPAYNEENRLPSYLNSIVEYFETAQSYEIVVVDDGSTDSTAAIVESLADRFPAIRLIRLPANCGKGYAVKTGMMNSGGRLRLFADADGATPITELPRLKTCIDKGADVAIASRALTDGSCVVNARLHRKIMGSVYNVLVQMIAVRGFRDTQCGFKLFTGDAARVVFPLQRVNRFGFDVEILHICQRRKFKVCEVPVNWTEVETSKVRLVVDSCRMLAEAIQVRFNGFKGYYDR